MQQCRYLSEWEIYLLWKPGSLEILVRIGIRSRIQTLARSEIIAATFERINAEIDVCRIKILRLNIRKID